MPFVAGKNAAKSKHARLQRDSESIGGQPRREKSGENKGGKKRAEEETEYRWRDSKLRLEIPIIRRPRDLSSRTVDGIIALNRKRLNKIEMEKTSKKIVSKSISFKLLKWNPLFEK